MSSNQKQPIKNCFECSGEKEMARCPVYTLVKKNVCTYRMVAENDWVKHLNEIENITLSNHLNEFIKKHKLETIPITTVGKRIDLSEKIEQHVVETVEKSKGDNLYDSLLVLLTYGDFKGEIEKTREFGYRGPIAIFSDDEQAKKYGKRLGADEICSTKEEVYKTNKGIH
jgi:hypothetical protein